MTIHLNTYWGAVSFTSDKVAEENFNGLTKKEIFKVQLKFFPLEEYEIEHIDFIPKEDKFDTQEYRDALRQYLREEGFLSGGGNFKIFSQQLQTI